MSLSFKSNPALAAALMRWWRALEHDPGGRAGLRRADSVTTLMLCPPFQRLRQSLVGHGWPDGTGPRWHDERLAAVAGLLAHVKETDDSTLPRRMSDGEKPAVSELRFLRLLESPDLDALFAGLRRALPMVQHRADVVALADDVLHFHADDGHVRKRWAYAYQWPKAAAA